MVTNGRSVRSRSGSRGGGRRLARGLLDLGREVGRDLQLGLDLRDPVAEGLRAHLVARAGPGPLDSRTWHHPSVLRVLILLPPSEGKTAPRRGAPLRPDTWPDGLAEPRERVLSALERLCGEDPEAAITALGLGPTQADDVRRNARLRESPDRGGRADLHRGALRRARAHRRSTRPRTGGRWPGSRSSRRCTGWCARASGSRRTGSPAASTCPALGVVAAHWRSRPRSRRTGGGRQRADRRPALLDVRRVLATRGRPGAARGHRPSAARGRRSAAGGQPLQQGDQGPARPGPARGRPRRPHPARPRRPAHRPRLARRGARRRPRRVAGSTWSSASSEQAGPRDDPRPFGGREAAPGAGAPDSGKRAPTSAAGPASARRPAAGRCRGAASRGDRRPPLGRRRRRRR